MKKAVIACVCFVFAVIAGNEIVNFSLFRTTDKYVDALYTEYESFGFCQEGAYTACNYYHVQPAGRMMAIQIQHVASDFEYAVLKGMVNLHYLFSTRVKDVYICQGGTVIVDCRYRGADAERFDRELGLADDSGSY